ncbi:hypothetical protein BDV93DRAFT_557810 [Ceratobasidium sp. AG-I]|nr:hypothetical protein BDV93DRAFT_557810 [Ceratobasidium sp. AG-I]
MPSLTHLALSYEVCVHPSAMDFLEATEHALLEQERKSNLVLARALERAAWEVNHTSPGPSHSTLGMAPADRSRAWWTRRRAGGGNNREVARDFWVTCWTVQTSVAASSSATTAAPTKLPGLDMALSILNSDPIFIFTPRTMDTVLPSFLSPRIAPIIRILSHCAPAERISRIFALSPIAESFAEAWSAQTNAVRAPESECGVFSTYCTVGTFGGVQGGSLPQGHWVGVVGADRVGVVARMYYEFEKEMMHHPITPESAKATVEKMIQQGQIWVYTCRVQSQGGGECEEVCAMAALSRHTPAVAALSGVYTLPRFRKMKFAERLVSRVCHRVFEMNKTAVLFVPQGNAAAGNLLGRIGFYGMGPRAALGEAAETWREVGFVGGIRPSGSW